MDNSDSDYKPPIDQRRYQRNFLRNINRLRPFPRYLRQPMNNRTRSYGMPVVQPRGVKFLQPNPSFRPSSPDLQPRMRYETPHNPNSSNPTEPSNKWYKRWKILDRIRSLITYIIKLVQYIQTWMQQHTASCGCSCSCICVGITTTVTVTAVGVGLGVGLGVGIKNDSGDIDISAAANQQMATSSAIIPASTLICLFTMILIGLLKARVW